jgi:hypothetical protein
MDSCDMVSITPEPPFFSAGSAEAESPSGMVELESMSIATLLPFRRPN